ncbi:hypothetical protein VHUM_04014 [Vanrija humicola]|uniref:Uncharacterized protein n=1 Tax=Vanrija humicola TaxID=5417 RepID=A0A7D8V2P7_VANHU|nr:hypothetical protein VHUM_04014 [Vanrija humicola]
MCSRSTTNFNVQRMKQATAHGRSGSRRGTKASSFESWHLLISNTTSLSASHCVGGRRLKSSTARETRHVDRCAVGVTLRLNRMKTLGPSSCLSPTRRMVSVRRQWSRSDFVEGAKQSSSGDRMGTTASHLLHVEMAAKPTRGLQTLQETTPMFGPTGSGGDDQRSPEERMGFWVLCVGSSPAFMSAGGHSCMHEAL